MNIQFNANFSKAQNLSLKSRITNPNLASEERSEELSFRGKRFEGKKLSKSLIALSAAALGSLGLRKKNDAQDPGEINEIQQAEKDDPSFFEALRSRIHYVGRDQDIEVRNYSDETIFVLSKYNKQDPEFAYELAKLVEVERGELLDVGNTEYLAKNLKEKPEVVEKIKYSGNPKETIKLLEMHETSPNEIEGLVEVNKIRSKFDRFSASDIELLIEPYKLDPEALTELAALKQPETKFTQLFNAREIAYLTPRYKEDKDTISLLLMRLYSGYKNHLGNTIVTLLDLYKENPVNVNYVVDSNLFDNSSSIKEAVDLYNTPEGNKYLKKIVTHITRTGLDSRVSSRDVLKTVSDSIENDKFLSDLEQKIPDISKEFNIRTLPKLNKLSEDDRKNVYRIIQDGRISEGKIIHKIFELLPIYSKYPDKTITDTMIERYKDPLSKIFNL